MTTTPQPGGRSGPQRRRQGRRGQVLRAVKAADAPIGIAALAEQLAVHPNTVRFHLEALTSAGQVEQVATTPTGPGRPAALYRAVPGMDPQGPTQYQVLARMLVEDIAADPQPRTRAIAAGQRWGARYAARRSAEQARQAGQDEDLTGGPAAGDSAQGDPGQDPPEVTRLVEVLEELDFDPERHPAAPDEVGLRHCPFLDLVQDHPMVVCTLHLGLMQGAMRHSGTEVADLVPFSRPDLCVAHLRPK